VSVPEAGTRGPDAVAGPAGEARPAAPVPSPWPRLLVIQALQLPAVALILAADRPAAWWTAALWSSFVCCAGTDSGWRWLNRLLVAQATLWLAAAGVFGL
jgi:hypothetical protein